MTDKKSAFKSNQGKRINTREIVLQMLMEVLEKGEYGHLVLKSVLDKYAYLDKTDRSFMKRLTEGVIERKPELDYIINCFSKTKTEHMKPVIREIIRMGTYQIFYMERVPDNAACNEAVKLAQAHGFASLKGFVNGVLRTIAREKDSIDYPDRTENPVEYLAVHYSMPKWIVEMWLSRFGMEETEKILGGLLEKRPLMIRIQTEEHERKALTDEMRKSGMTLRQTKELAYAYEIGQFDRVEMIPGFLTGKVMVQDLGSMIITEAAGIREGDFVMDVCGAPGGKALHAAYLAGRKGHVIARDLSEYKVSLIKENLERSGLDNVTVQVWDATVFDEAYREKADVVIADLPCSGLGVIGRKADIKYRLKKEDIAEVAALQRQILMTVQAYVKKGGVLMYSTCTLTEEENEQNVKWFTENYPFRASFTRTLFPTGKSRMEGAGGQEGDMDSTDGFFMARLEKTEEDFG